MDKIAHAERRGGFTFNSDSLLFTHYNPIFFIPVLSHRFRVSSNYKKYRNLYLALDTFFFSIVFWNLVIAVCFCFPCPFHHIIAYIGFILFFPLSLFTQRKSGRARGKDKKEKRKKK